MGAVGVSGVVRLLRQMCHRAFILCWRIKKVVLCVHAGLALVAGINSSLQCSVFLAVLDMTGMSSRKRLGWLADRRESENDINSLHGGFILKLAILSTLFQYDSWGFCQVWNIWPHLARHFMLCLVLNGRADPLRSRSRNLSLVHHQIQDDYLKFVWTSRENKIELKISASRFFLWILPFQLLLRNEMKAAFVLEPLGLDSRF